MNPGISYGGLLYEIAPLAHVRLQLHILLINITRGNRIFKKKKGIQGAHITGSQQKLNSYIGKLKVTK